MLDEDKHSYMSSRNPRARTRGSAPADEADGPATVIKRAASFRPAASFETRVLYSVDRHHTLIGDLGQEA